MDERGQRRLVRVPVERDLTVYVDRREVVTLMTLGAHPEWLVLGWLLHQNLINSVAEIESVSVDWEVAAAAVHTRQGDPIASRIDRRRIITSGCGQGSMFADVVDRIAPVGRDFPPLRHSELLEIVDAVRTHDTLYKSAGSVHACALFDGARLQIFIEDVGRHNALDSIAGWRAMLPQPAVSSGIGLTLGQAACPVLYTTGRLTSEMIIKSAQMGIPVAVSRSGTTELAIDMATRLGICTIGRALNRRFLCYTHAWRLSLESSGSEVS